MNVIFNKKNQIRPVVKLILTPIAHIATYALVFGFIPFALYYAEAEPTVIGGVTAAYYIWLATKIKSEE